MMNPCRQALGACLLIVSFGPAWACATLATAHTDHAPNKSSPRFTTIYIVRHAEKDGGPDPALTAAGRARAGALNEALGWKAVDAIYATRYRRTQETVAPYADNHGLRVAIAPDAQALVHAIKTAHRGKRVLVASHSNVIPVILAELGVKEDVVIGHGDYGALYVVTLHPRSVTLRTRRFGD